MGLDAGEMMMMNVRGRKAVKTKMTRRGNLNATSTITNLKKGEMSRPGKRKSVATSRLGKRKSVATSRLGKRKSGATSRLETRKSGATLHLPKAMKRKRKSPR